MTEYGLDLMFFMMIYWFLVSDISQAMWDSLGSYISPFHMRSTLNLVWSTFLLLGVSGLFAIVDLYNWPTFMAKRKIQNEELVTVDMYKKALGNFFVNLFMINVPLSYLNTTYELEERLAPVG